MFRCYGLFLFTEAMLIPSAPHFAFTQSKSQAHGNSDREKSGHSKKKVDFDLTPPTPQPDS